MITVYRHLDEEAQRYADAADELRIAYIARRRFVEYPEIQHIGAMVERMLARPRTLRPPCLLISADSGAGKSSLLDHLQQCYPERTGDDVPGPLLRPLVRIADLRTHGGKAMLEYVVRHLQGHIQYYGVSGNFRSVQRYLHYARRLLFKWLNRRSQRRSVTWPRFHRGVGPHLPRARIVHNLYPTPPWMTQAGSRMV